MLLLAAQLVACGRLAFDPSTDGDGGASGDGGVAIPRCPIPTRPVVANPVTTITSCSETAVRDALTAGGGIRFDCGSGAVVSVTSPLVVNTSVIIDGHGVTFDGQDLTSVMQVVAGGQLTLLDATIQHGRSTSGGAGIRVEFDGSAVIYDSSFLDNVGPTTGGDAGGAIAALPSNATVAVYGTRFERNAAPNGGGVAAYADLTIANSVFRDNHATDPAGAGGGIFAVGTGNLSLCEVSVENNTGNDLSGGIQRISTSNAGVDQWDRVHLRGNTAGGGGVGGAYVQDVDLTLRQVDIADNTGGVAGGLWFESPSHVFDGENVSVIGNTSTDGLGGGLRFTMQSGRLAFSTVANNASSCATCWAGALYGVDPLTLVASVLADNSAGTTPTTCGGGALDGGSVVQWPADTTMCTATVSVVDPGLGGVQDASGVDGTYRVRPPGAGSLLSTVSSGCPSIDITGRPRPTPCTIGALEPL